MTFRSVILGLALVALIFVITGFFGKEIQNYIRAAWQVLRSPLLSAAAPSPCKPSSYMGRDTNPAPRSTKSSTRSRSEASLTRAVISTFSPTWGKSGILSVSWMMGAWLS